MGKNQHKPFVAFLVCVFGLSLAGSVCAEEPHPEANWANIKQIATGDEVQVVLHDAKSINGRFQTFSDNAITLRTITGEQTLSREGVLRVSAKGKSHRLRNALIGAGLGAGVGAAIGAACCKDNEVLPGGGVAAGALGATFGATGLAVGALMPTGGWRVVYRAR